MDVRQIEWETFSSIIKEHYQREGHELEMKFGIEGKDISKFVLHDREKGLSRILNLWEAYEAIGKILFPEEPVAVFSIYKPREASFGKEYVYIAVKPVEARSAGPE